MGNNTQKKHVYTYSSIIKEPPDSLKPNLKSQEYVCLQNQN